MKSILVCGAGGFIGSHLVKKLKTEGFWVRGVDLKYPRFSDTVADDFVIGDLRDQQLCAQAVDRMFDEVYQLAADMGGAGYIFTGDNDADVMSNSALININILERCRKHNIKRVFYSSSACVYPEYNQMEPDNPKTSEESVYPAAPDSEYGWEKLFSERLYLSFQRNHGIECRIARFHNIFGPEGSWNDGREKSPAALCRKVAEAGNGGEIEVWGDGKQTRSYLFIDACLEGMDRFMRCDWSGPVNLGSDEMISVNALARMIIDISGKNLSINNVPGPLGVRGRTSDNNLIFEHLSWRPKQSLIQGMEKTYAWVAEQVRVARQRSEAVAS